MPTTTAAGVRRERGPSLYVHVPFCVVKCGYCDFNSFAVADPALHDRFLAALDRELGLARPGRQPSSVFIGGGTPTYLDPIRFARLLAIVREHVDLATVEEVTIEANPESATLEKLAAARDAGVNRISIGAQSFAAANLAFLDRPHDGAAIARAVAAAREAGFDNVSLDLIYGLPAQSAAEWHTDLAAALELGPDHLSCYNLTFERGTRLTKAMRRGEVSPNPESTDLELFHNTRAVLAGAGFHPYEISNFARPWRRCRHNDHYWLQGDYLGVGPGASSHWRGVRSTNLRPVESWAGVIESGQLPAAEAETLGSRQRAAEALWLGLRRTDGVELDLVRRRTGVDPRLAFRDRISQLTDSGLLADDGGSIRLTERGLPVADSVAAAFLGD